MTMTSPVPERIATRISTWQQTMVDTKRQDRPSHELVARQQEFLKAAADSTRELVDYLVDQLGFDVDILASSPPLDRVTSDEMTKTPQIWERYVGAQLAEVLPSQAISSPWWYACHTAWLQNDVFPDPPDSTFKARVGQATLRQPAARTSIQDRKLLDDATRQLLRGLGGLPHIRRVKSVATDPPIARAYWRWRLAVKAAAHAPPEAELTADMCHDILHRSSWTKFIEGSQKKYSAVLAPRALAAVCAIAQADQRTIREPHIQTIARRCLQAHPDLIDWPILTHMPVTPETPSAKPASRRAATKRTSQRALQK